MGTPVDVQDGPGVTDDQRVVFINTTCLQHTAAGEQEVRVKETKPIDFILLNECIQYVPFTTNELSSSKVL